MFYIYRDLLFTHKLAISYFWHPSTSCITDHRSPIFSSGYTERIPDSYHKQHSTQVFSAALFPCLQNTPCRSCPLDSNPYVVRIRLLDQLLYRKDRILQVSFSEPFLLHNIPASCPCGSHRTRNPRYPIPASVCACAASPYHKQHSARVPSCEISMMINHFKG